VWKIRSKIALFEKMPAEMTSPDGRYGNLRYCVFRHSVWYIRAVKSQWNANTEVVIEIPVEK